jgi:diacylglycerol kinase (ATP)
LTYKPEILLLPIGSGNDFARAIGSLGKPLEEIFSAFASGQTKIIKSDVGLIRFRKNGENEFSERKFISSCGIGLDAFIAQLSNRSSILKGLPLYLSSALKAIFTFKPMRLSIIIDGKEAENGMIHLAAIGNTPSSGGGFHLTPEALIADGLHNLTVAKAMPVFSLLKLLPQAIHGTHIHDPRVKTHKFTECHITLERPEFVHCDGEVLGDSIIEVIYKVIPENASFSA